MMARAWLCSFFVLFASVALADDKAQPSEGVLPVDAQGQPINLDFETGDLRDWVADGEAFRGQPIKGDTVAARRGDMRSNHVGQFWIGTYEKGLDKPQGTLTSASFKVTHPWASFLVAGGPHETTCVQIVRKDSDKIIKQVSGHETENLERVPVDLREHQGQEIFIRLVDKHRGGWGHLNFDDFRLHATKPNIPDPPKLLRVVDLFPNAGLTPDEAAKAMTVPEGFKVTAFAGEPDVKQPIAMTIDDRGRLWVAEAFSYPVRVPEDKARDRILIFEDVDNDGKFDKRTVFVDNLNLVSGIEVGFGGVWVGAAPQFLFIPDRDGDDKPDGPPEVLLDGWGYQDTHETLNSFIWGPDGWLYGCHGVFTHSRVGKPGTPNNQRVPLNAGIWRYHPTKHVFDVFAHGTSNPWGVDFNDHGQCFLSCCVIPHLFHMIQGARYHRQGGEHFNPHTYADIPTIARHRHWVGNQWNDADRARSNDNGGGHAHAGAMIYLGGAWPAKYRNQLFMNNIHGARINQDLLEADGSGYIGNAAPDFIKTNDLWSQILYLRYGPDGQAYMIDWYDNNQCHHGNVAGHDRSNGRIFKVSYVGMGGSPVPGREKPEVRSQRSEIRGQKSASAPSAENSSPTLPKGVANFLTHGLRAMTDLDLVNLQLHQNDWYVRTARRLLQERAAAGKLDAKARPALATLAFQHDDVTCRLRGLWALHVTGGLTEEHVQAGLQNDSDQVRAWTIQLAMENDCCGRTPDPATDADRRSPPPPPPPPSTNGRPAVNEPAGSGDPRRTLSERTLAYLSDLARADESPVVRLYITSAVQRLPLEQRWDILTGLLSQANDADDHNLPLMYWYATEPLAVVDTLRALKLASEGNIPLVLEFMVRRIGSLGTPESLDILVREVAETNDEDARLTILRGLRAGLKGRRQVPMPASWNDVSAKLTSSRDAETRTLAFSLAVTFGDPASFTKMREQLSNIKTPAEQRREYLATLLAAKDAKLLPVLHGLLKDAALRAESLRGLAVYDDAKTPALILGVYGSLSPAEKRDALNTLSARANFARAMLASVGTDKNQPIKPTDLSADLIRQLRNLRDDEVNRRIGEVWGVARETAEDKVKLIAHYKQLVEAKPAAEVDLSLGRAIYAKTCQQCHTLFGIGGKIGPELTGSNRANLDYLLSNIIDPSAVMAREYIPSVIVTTEGRVLTGLVREQTANSVTVVTANETVVVPKGEIDEMKKSDKSMMPDDQLKQFQDGEVRSLFAYLASPRQVPLLATADNVATLFNGRDLTGWEGNPDLWSVENGEIVGKSPGLTRNEFLVSQMLAGDFRFSLQVKLTPNAGNSGIQFRSEALAGGEVKGYQADVGVGWWGKLYEEHGRGLLWDKSGEAHVKPDDWNDYRVEAVGGKIRTWINGQPCVDLNDPDGAKRGILALQLHSGGKFEVRFRDLKLELISK
jgi:putative membrane-bound dehydrogenase-like protein